MAQQLVPNVNGHKLLERAQLMIESKLGLEWSIPNGVRVDYLDREILEKMKAARARRHASD